MADNYIRQWATEILVYDKAKDKTDKQIEALAEDYRRSLYVHQYEQRLIQRMPKHASEAQIDSFYTSHKNAYILKETLVRGILLIVPTGAPDLHKVLKWLQTPTEENIEKIEKYAYRYATGYELFIDEWRTSNQLLLLVPFSQSELAQELKQKSQIVKNDPQTTYILQVTDKRMAGEPMPIEYARDEIERLLLRDSAVNYLKNEHERLATYTLSSLFPNPGKPPCHAQMHAHIDCHPHNRTRAANPRFHRRFWHRLATAAT